MLASPSVESIIVKLGYLLQFLGAGPGDVGTRELAGNTGRADKQTFVQFVENALGNSRLHIIVFGVGDGHEPVQISQSLLVSGQNTYVDGFEGVQIQIFPESVELGDFLDAPLFGHGDELSEDLRGDSGVFAGPVMLEVAELQFFDDGIQRVTLRFYEAFSECQCVYAGHFPVSSEMLLDRVAHEAVIEEGVVGHQYGAFAELYESRENGLYVLCALQILVGYSGYAGDQ